MCGSRVYVCDNHFCGQGLFIFNTTTNHAVISWISPPGMGPKSGDTWEKIQTSLEFLSAVFWCCNKMLAFKGWLVRDFLLLLSLCLWRLIYFSRSLCFYFLIWCMHNLCYYSLFKASPTKGVDLFDLFGELVWAHCDWWAQMGCWRLGAQAAAWYTHAHPGTVTSDAACMQRLGQRPLWVQRSRCACS